MPLLKINENGEYVPIEKFEPAENESKPGYFDIIGAAWEEENSIGSALAEEEGLPTSRSAVEFDVLNKEHKDYVQQAIDSNPGFTDDEIFAYSNVRTDAENAAVTNQIMRQRKNRELISQADFGTQMLANATVALADFDLATFVPFVGQVKKATKLAKVGIEASKGAALGAGSGYLTETFLRQTQIGRDPDDLMYSTIGGAVFGGVIGAGISAFKGIDYNDIKLQIGKALVDEREGKSVFGQSSASAAEVVQTTLEQEGIAGGKVAQSVGKTLSKERAFLDDPVLQGLMSPFKTARNLTQELSEKSGLKIQKAKEGIAVSKGGSLESLNKLARGAVIKSNRFAKDSFIKMRKGRERKVGDMFALDIADSFSDKGMSYVEFRKQVGIAMRNGDTHEVPEVAEAAKFYRKEVFDPMVKRAVELDLLPEGVSVDTADSYLTRIYDIAKIQSNPSGFADITHRWLKEQQQKNSDIQDEVMPLIEERDILQQSLKKDEKRIKKGEQRGDILKAQTEEGFRYLRDIRNRIGVGKKTVDNMRRRVEDISAKIFEKEGASDALIQTFNDELGGRIIDINDRLLSLFEGKKQAFENKKSFNRMLKKARNLKDFVPKRKNPVMQFLKGRIDPQGRFAAELAAMDITLKTMPGYFKKGRSDSLDNIALDEFPELADNLGLSKDTNPDGYFSERNLLDAIADEQSGNPIVMYDDMGRLEKHNEIKGFKEELEGMGIDLNSDDVFDQYNNLQSQRRSFDSDEDVSISDNEQLLKDLDFFDRASEVIPDIRKTLDEAIQRINKMPDRKKVEIDADLREFKNLIDGLEKELKLDRTKFKERSKSLQAKEKEFARIEKERGIIDRDATRKAKGRTKTLLKKIDDVNELRSKSQSNETRLRELEDQIIELAARWNSKTGKEFRDRLKTEKGGDLDEIIETIRTTQTNLDDAELLSIAEEIRQRIVSTPDGRLPYASKLNEDGSGGGSPSFDKGNKPSMFKNRAFAIPDNLIQDYLISDIEDVAGTYMHKTARFMNMYERFNGDIDLKNKFKEIEAEYNDAVRGKTGKEAEKLSKEYKNTIKKLAVLRDRALGVDALPADPTAGWTRAGRSIRTFNVLSMLGGMTISAIPDLGRLVLLGSPVMRDGVAPIIKNLGNGKTLKKMQELNDLGVVAEVVTNSRLQQIGDIADDVQTRTKIERSIDYAGDKFGIASFMAPWNEINKQIVAITTEATILRLSQKLLNGKATKAEIEALANNGFDKEVAARVVNQFKKYGESENGLNYLNAADWDDKFAKDAFLSALVQETDRIIGTPGYEKSVTLNSHEFFKTMAQFKSFFFMATTKIMLRGLQEGTDPRNVGAFVAMTNLGMLTYAIKTAQAGKELSDNPAIWLIEGFDRAGIGGIVMEVNNIAEKGMGVGLRPAVGGEVASRYMSRSVADSFMGPTFGQVLNLTKIARAIGTGEWSEGDVNAAVRMLPGQNLPYIKPLTNELKEALK